MLGISEIQELLDRHGLEARKSLGQNFVADPNVVRRIVEHAGVQPGDSVVEIGPGVGSLTTALLEAGAIVHAIEKDSAFAAVLNETCAEHYPDTFELLISDALNMDWSDSAISPATLVSNLPYNVAVPIILTVLQKAPQIDPLVVMVQSEVAERLCATPGGRTIGVPTIKAGWFASARIVMDVPPTVFIPQPRVESAVVRLDRRPPPAEAAGNLVTPRDMFSLVEAAYQQRRKMLRKSLKGRVTEEQFASAEIESTARPETLAVVDWARLAAEAKKPTGNSGGA